MYTILSYEVSRTDVKRYKIQINKDHSDDLP